MALTRVVVIVAVSAIAVYCGLKLRYPQAATPDQPAALAPPARTVDSPAATAPAASGPLTTAALPPEPALPRPPPAHTVAPADEAAADDTPAAPVAGPAKVSGPWWAAAGSGATHLALLQADEAGFEPGIALLFSSAVSAQAAGRYIRVLDRKGRSVGGQWQLSADNPRMMLFPAAGGTYTLVLSPGLADVHGSALGTALRGTVTVH